MGLVKKAAVDTPPAGGAGPRDMSTVIRQAVEAEIERQRRAKQEADAARDGEGDSVAPDEDS